MDGPKGYDANLNNSDRERQILLDFTYMRNLKAKINKQNRNKLIDIGNKLMVAGQERG